MNGDSCARARACSTTTTTAIVCPTLPVLTRILLILDTARQSDDAARVSNVPHDKATPLCGERRVGAGDRLIERLVGPLKRLVMHPHEQTGARRIRHPDRLLRRTVG